MECRILPIPVSVSANAKKLLASEQFLHYIDPRLAQINFGRAFVIAIIFHSPIMYGALPMA
jgi:hypothetical protein